MNYKGFCNQVNEMTHKEYIVGSSLEIENIGHEEEVRKDIEIQGIQHISIWGQLKDNNNKPIARECVRLIRIYGDRENEKLEVVKTTVTDELGYYTLSTYGKESESYTVLVDCQMLVPESHQVVKETIGLGATKHKTISDYIKFSK